MQLTLPDYIVLVVETFKKKRQNNELSPLLVALRRANIRQECINVYNRRMNNGERDEVKILTAFFGEPPAGKNFVSVIEKCDLDKFRPLQNLIEKGIKNPNMASVELLAWLIDFRLRPYVLGMDAILDADELNSFDKGIVNAVSKQESNNVTANTISTTDPIGVGLSPQKVSDLSPIKGINSKKKTMVKAAVTMLLVSGILCGGIYIFRQKENKQPMSLGTINKGCMYWSVDHYEEMLCNEEKKDVLKLPMDLERLKSFKRIMREDTITEKSIGTIFYIKINRTIEYYTAGGNHPIEIARPLHQLTAYMFEKYLKKQNTVKTSL